MFINHFKILFPTWDPRATHGKLWAYCKWLSTKTWVRSLTIGVSTVDRKGTAVARSTVLSPPPQPEKGSQLLKGQVRSFSAAVGESHRHLVIFMYRYQQGSHISGLTNFPDFSSISNHFSSIYSYVLIFQSMTSTYYWVIVLQTGSQTVVNLLHHTYYLYNTQ